MELIPESEFQRSNTFNFAPMVDFLFLMLSLFATFAISQAAVLDTEVRLAEVREKGDLRHHSQKRNSLIRIAITSSGEYLWKTDHLDQIIPNPHQIQTELQRQWDLGILPQEKRLTEVLLQIDRSAPWEPVAQAIYAIHQSGFVARPVYEPTP